VICLEQFENGGDIRLIPMCEHYFHPDCCTQWLESKYQANEQRCPQCNIELTIKGMAEAKAEYLKKGPNNPTINLDHVSKDNIAKVKPEDTNQVQPRFEPILEDLINKQPGDIGVEPG
jgi:hypothetical protein